MSYQIQDFIVALIENENYSADLYKYNQMVQPLEEIEQKSDLIFYKEYVGNFPVQKVKVPEEIDDLFDWDLLQQLAAASLSSEVKYVWNNENDNALLDFVITVTSGEQKVSKVLSELWGFQISRLFEIYLSEQINLEYLRHEDPVEKEAIEHQRQLKISQAIKNAQHINFDIQRILFQKKLLNN